MATPTKQQPIALDTSQVDEHLRKQAQWLSSQELARGGARALNRAGRAARTAGARAVRQQLRVRARDVRDRIKPKRATPSRLVFVLEFDYRPLPLHLFGNPTQGRLGFAVTIKRGGTRLRIPHGFMVDKYGGASFVRKKADNGEGLVARGPIRGLLGPSIGSQLEEARPAMEARANEVLEERLRHEVEWRVERANR